MLICCFILTAANSVSAASWRIKSVRSSDTSTDNGGFGFSGLHTPNSWNVMSGSALEDITGATGTYNDVTGEVDYVFSLDNSTSFTLKGNLIFNQSINGQSSFLGANSTLAYMGLNSSGSGISENGTFGFLPGDVCCGGIADPNSFIEQMNGTYFMTLWGADGFNDITGTYSGSTVGMDFRVELEQVPLPPALWLMFSGFGLIIAKSRKRVVQG